MGGLVERQTDGLTDKRYTQRLANGQTNRWTVRNTHTHIHTKYSKRDIELNTKTGTQLDIQTDRQTRKLFLVDLRIPLKFFSYFEAQKQLFKLYFKHLWRQFMEINFGR